MRKFLFIIILHATICIDMHSQYSSPQSSIGEGRRLDNNFSLNRLNGGLSAGYTNNLAINYQNPASNADAIMTILEVGVKGENGTFSLEDSSKTSGGISLSHFAMKFPMKSGHSGISMGIFQNTSSDYNTSAIGKDSSFGDYKTSNYGDGSTYKAFIGSGFRVKNFKFGGNLNFKFGGINDYNALEFIDSATLPSIVEKQSTSIAMLSYTLGTQYNFLINKYNSILLGAYYENDLLKTPNRRIEKFVSYSTSSNVVKNYTQLDTTIDIDYPSIASYGFGFTHTYKEYFSYGIDMNISDLSGFNDRGGKALQKSWVIKSGIEYKPVLNRALDNRKYLNKIVYRVGGGFGKSEYNYPSSINYLNINAGVSLPLLTRNTGYISLGIGYKNIGMGELSQYSENIFSVHAILTFADLWFIKSKFD